VFERAHGGTLFLDEITEMSPDLQVRLLRVLEANVVTRIGAEEPRPVDVRVVAATNRDPTQAVRDGKLREDLHYRLAVFPIAIPPLRDRSDDIPLLAEHFLAELNRQAMPARPKRVTEAAIQRLREHAWPGNIRELKNVLERAFILAGDAITVRDIPLENGIQPRGGEELALGVGTSLAEAERRLILATLEQVGGNKKRAAEVLGISLKTLYTRLRAYKD
jgi:DNA-binding NtrC family response regulator